MQGNIEYNIVEDMKKQWENITLFDLAQLPKQMELIIRTFSPTISTSKDIYTYRMFPTSKPQATTNTKVIINATNTGVNSWSQVPPFLLTFNIFNYNLPNCLIDSKHWYNIESFKRRN